MKKLIYLITFLTVFGLLAAQVNLPYVQEFDGESASNTGILSILGMTGSLSVGRVGLDNGMLSVSHTGMMDAAQWIITPLLVATSDETLITLEVGLDGQSFSDSGTIQVQISTTDSQQASFTTITNGLINVTSHPGPIANFISIELSTSDVTENDEFFVRLLFTPNAWAMRTVYLTTLSVTDAGGGTPEIPIFAIDPATADFGTLSEGDTATPIEFTITNTGDGTLTVSNIEITGTDNAYFVLDPAFASNVDITDGDFTFDVNFVPVTFGDKTANLVITHNAAGSPTTIPLTGNHESTTIPVVPLPYHQEFNGGPATGNNVFNHLDGMTGRTVGMTTLSSGFLQINFQGPDAFNQWIITPLIGQSTGNTEINLDINLNGYTFSGEDRIEFSYSTTDTDDGSFTKIYEIDNTTHPNPISSMTTISVPKTTLIPENSDFYIRVDFYVFTQSVGFGNPNTMIVDNLIVRSAPLFNPPRNLVKTHVSRQEIVLEWEAPLAGSDGELAGFRVYRKSDTETVHFDINNPNTLTFTNDISDIQLFEDFEYYVEARYINPEGYSEPSNSVFVELYTILPVTVSSFSANATTDGIRVSWAAETEIKILNYRILRAETNDLNVAKYITSREPSATQNYYYLDRDVTNEQIYYYWIQANGIDGSLEIYGPVNAVFVTITEQYITRTIMSSVYPNPLNTGSRASFDISVKSNETAELKIFNIRGQLVREFSELNTGQHTVVWDGRDVNGREVGSGIYLYQLSSPTMHEIKRMIKLN